MSLYAAQRVSIILIRNPGDVGDSAIIVPLEGLRLFCVLTSSWGSADETLAEPCGPALCPMWGRGEKVAGLFFLQLHYYQACLSLGHFIKTSLVLLKNFRELISLMENFQ